MKRILFFLIVPICLIGCSAIGTSSKLDDGRYLISVQSNAYASSQGIADKFDEESIDACNGGYKLQKHLKSEVKTIKTYGTNPTTSHVLVQKRIIECKLDNEPYIVSGERNDIQKYEPELWSWLKIQNNKNYSKIKQAKDIYPKQLQYVKGLSNDSIQVERRKPLEGVWIDCGGNNTGSVYKFLPNGRFHSFEKKFDKFDCTGDAKPGVSGFGFEFMGYYLVGKNLDSKVSGATFELDLIHIDSARSKNYDESKAYYKVVNINNRKLRFSSRGNPSVLLPPKKRNLRLDKEKYTYNKCDCLIEVE